MAHQLTKLGVLAKPYHAGNCVLLINRIGKLLGLHLMCLTSAFTGLKAGDRTEVQTEWMQGKVLVIAATISFGMGVDKANVR